MFIADRFAKKPRWLVFLMLAVWALLFYSIVRLEFLVWHWGEFSNKPMADLLLAFSQGVRFDISSVFITMVPLLLWTWIPWPIKLDKFRCWVALVLYAVPQIVFLVVNVADIEYINFTGRRISYDGLFILAELNGKYLNFLLSYWQLVLLNLLLITVFLLGALTIVFEQRRLKQQPLAGPALGAANRCAPSESLNSILFRYAAHLLCGVLMLLITVIAVRGGLQSKPLSFVHANVFEAPLLNNLVLNSSFTLVRSAGQTAVTPKYYFKSTQQLEPLLNGAVNGVSALEGKRPQVVQNIAIIILESFSSEYTGKAQQILDRAHVASHVPSYTPFLDELAQRPGALVFTNTYANGRKSIEGIAAVMAGIPTLMNQPYISSKYSTNSVMALGATLGNSNYDSAFFHGGHNGTMFFDAFMRGIGIKHYFGFNEFANSKEDDGVWGIWDEPFFQFALDKTAGMKQPFLFSMFSLTSHQPYAIPAQYQGVFKEGPHILTKSVEYSDYALKQFFQRAQQQPWFNNTLFIITADHTGQHSHPEFSNDLGNYEVPIIFYHPGYQWPADIETDQPIAQTDILPSIYDFLGITPPRRNLLGRSVFVPGEREVVTQVDGSYWLFAKDAYLVWGRGESTPRHYAIFDRNAQQPLPESPRKAALFAKLKATIQYFNNGLLQDTLYVPR
ncbi:phosphoglycerol transferase MdoB-like AlkP superfamily enzyme [Pseudomonas sp. TE3786]